MSDVQKTYAAFSGVDGTMYINGKAIGEVCSISWEAVKEIGLSSGYKGILEMAIFGDRPPINIHKEPLFTLEVHYCTEYGDKMVESFVSPSWVRYSAKRSIDDMYLTDFYEFQAESIKRTYTPNTKEESSNG